MLQVVCPACNAPLSVSKELQGKQVSCGSCGKSFLIANEVLPVVTPSETVSTQSDSTQPIPSGPVIQTRGKASRARVRSRSKLTKIISLVVQLAISCGAVYAGYYIISQRTALPPQGNTAKPAPQLAKVEEPKHELTDLVEEKPIALPVEEGPGVVREEKPEPVVPHLVNLPSQISLPAADNDEIVTLFDGTGVQDLELISLSPHLKHQGKKIFWNDSKADMKPQTVGGLVVKDNKVIFRWMGEVPTEAESAMRNSVIKLNRVGQEEIVALRETKVIAPARLSLKKNVQRIVADLDCAPTADALFADFTALEQFPSHRVEGCDIHRMKVRDEAMLWYYGAKAAATKVTLKKMGKTYGIELDSRYMLPSGDEEPMSITKGGRKRKQLEKLMGRVNMAQKSLEKLNGYLSQLEKDLKASGSRQKKSQIQVEIQATRSNIAMAEKMVKQKSALEKELSELDRVAEVAQELHSKKAITYRFYTVIAGREVDLLIAR